MLTAFFDESAVDARSGPSFIFGGFVGSVEEWERASDAWQACLDEDPVVAHFHDQESKPEKRLALAKVISRFDIQGFAITVPHRWFVDRNAKAAKGMIGTRVYDWAFISAVNGVLSWVDDKFPPDESVDFVFDKRNELSLCRQLFEGCKEDQKGAWRRAGSCTPGDDEKIVALQMGDLLAGEMLRILKTGESTEVFPAMTADRPVFHLKVTPPEVIPKSLAAQDIGKRLVDDSRNFMLAVSAGKLDRETIQKQKMSLTFRAMLWNVALDDFREAANAMYDEIDEEAADQS